MFYSKATGGFYHPDIHKTIPADAVEISDDEHAMLLGSAQQIVAAPNGRPVVSDRPAPVKVSKADAIKLLSSAQAAILRNTARAYNYSSMEEVCGFQDGPFAEDGKFFRSLRDDLRMHLLGQFKKLADEQDSTDVDALIQELRDQVQIKRQGFTSVGIENG